MVEHLSFAVALMLILTAQDTSRREYTMLHAAFMVAALVLVLVHFFLAFATLL